MYPITNCKFLNTDSEIAPSLLEQVLFPPSFFNLLTKQSLIGIPLKREGPQIMVAFPYVVEKEKDSEENYVVVLKKLYPYPIVSLNTAATVYETTPVPSIEYKFLNTVLGSRKTELITCLSQLGLVEHEVVNIIDSYRRRRVQLE